MKNTIKIITFIIYLSASGLLYPQTKDEKVYQEAKKAYEKAYNLILDEKWNEADYALQEYLSVFNQYTDAASYWQCYTYERMNEDLEKAFQCYENFIQKYPTSTWIDEAQAATVNLATQLAQLGITQYKDIINNFQDDENDDIKLSALYALRNMNDEKSLSALISLYDKTNNKKIKSNIIYMLGSINEPVSRKKLQDIITNDPDTDVRKNALYAIQSTGNEETYRILRDIVNSKQNDELRTTAIYSLSRDRSDTTAIILGSIARKESNIQSARAAVYTQRAISSKQATTELERVVNEANAPEILEDALYFLIHREKDIPMKKLKEIAISNQNEKLWKAAIHAITNHRNKQEAVTALKEIYQKSSDIKQKETVLYNLSEITTKDAKEFLSLIVISEENENLARAAMFALTRFDNSIDPEILTKAKSVKVKEIIIHQLGTKGDLASVKLLGKILNENANVDIQEAAIMALGISRNDDAVPILAEIARSDKSKKLRQGAVSALGMINTEKARAALLEIIEGEPKR